MVTTETWERRDLLRNERWAQLLIDALGHYRGSAYRLHEFVIMPDHVHVLLTPLTSLEKAVQSIKGGFSYRVKKELGSNIEVWQKGFADHRIRDASDYRLHIIYIRQNPVKEHSCDCADDYPYSSACGAFELDGAPQGPKPNFLGADDGAPLQSLSSAGVSSSISTQMEAAAGVSVDLGVHDRRDSLSQLKLGRNKSDKIA
jgi:putative transposase